MDVWDRDLEAASRVMEALKDVLQNKINKDKSDDFYRLVAELVREAWEMPEYANRASAYLEDTFTMSHNLHVPKTTYHRWIKEARSRGFLGARPRSTMACRGCGVHCPPRETPWL